MRSKVDWPHVAIVALVIGGGITTLAIVLRLTPPHLLERLFAINWIAVIPAAFSAGLGIYAMLRRAGFFRSAPPPPPELDAGGDGEGGAP